MNIVQNIVMKSPKESLVVGHARSGSFAIGAEMVRSSVFLRLERRSNPCSLTER